MQQLNLLTGMKLSSNRDWKQTGQWVPCICWGFARVAFVASCVIQQKKVGDFYHFVPAEVITNVYKSGKVYTKRRLEDCGGQGSSNL